MEVGSRKRVLIAMKWSIRPKYLPQTQDLRVVKLALEEDQKPAKAEKQVARVASVKIGSQMGIDSLHKHSELTQLPFNASLVELKIQTLHTREFFKDYTRAHMVIRCLMLALTTRSM